MLYHILANLVVTIHFLFIGFVGVGGIFIFRWKWLILLHLPAVIWVLLLELNGWICPLTPLEVFLRNQAGQGGYSGGFIEHYLGSLIYPENLTPILRFIIAALVSVINGLVYGIFYYKIRQKSRILRE